MSESPRSKKKRTPRDHARERERAERAKARLEKRALRASVPYVHVDLDEALRDPRNWRYPSAPKGKGPRS